MYDDQSSNDVILVEENEGAKATGGPIIELFKSLITNDYKQNTVLTNAQIVDILQREFNINIQKIHDLEVEIYVNVVKKYLKDWPEWDGFEQSVIDFKSQNNSEAITSILEEKYLNLKKYLGSMLEIAKYLSPNVIKNIPIMGQMHKIENVNKENVVMEIQATKNQLNHLILRHPISNNSIFNVNEPLPKYYDYPNSLTLNSILSWCGIEIELKLKWAQGGVINLKYENCHKLQHTLVNKMLKLDSYQKSSLNQQWEVKRKSKNLTEISKDVILNLFRQCISNDRYRKWKDVLVSMHKILNNITQSMPSSVGVPGTFRKYLSKYGYVRFLYENVADEVRDDEKYDLQLQEVLSPMCQLYIGLHQSHEESIKIHCYFCQVTFAGENVTWEIENHFKSHIVEPDWQCVNCNKTITVSHLTKANWNHICEPASLYQLLSMKQSNNNI
ncbi:unnamed protein product [Parnassius apollo]|uniref:(apollo) hypothetical protein n=1 Tax=Parnassius apollo TaxID=110799 RepID=A0A8S3Y422_PARAO|nr:unnamed protein product [Parnassius apollo]